MVYLKGRRQMEDAKREPYSEREMLVSLQEHT
jgi:hypothetical protein